MELWQKNLVNANVLIANAPEANVSVVSRNDSIIKRDQLCADSFLFRLNDIGLFSVFLRIGGSIGGKGIEKTHNKFLFQYLCGQIGLLAYIFNK